MELTVSKLAERLGANLFGDGSAIVSRVWPIDAAASADVTFAAEQKFVARLNNCRAGAVIVGKRVDEIKIPQLIVADVNTALIETLKIFAPPLKTPDPGIHPAAKIAPDAKIGKNTSIGPMVVIEIGAQIGDNTVIAAGCKIGQNSKVGNNCRIDCNVVIYHNCSIGSNCIIQANTTIGSTGFGYRFIDGSHRLIPHNGGVVIEDFVEIGANCCVDRAKFGNTIIGAGTKIDNLVQVAHNCIIGKCCLMVGQSGIGGSTKLGDGVVLAGQAGIIDNIEIGTSVMIGAKSCVFENVPNGKKVVGTPAVESSLGLKIMASTKKLPKLLEQVRQLGERIKKLESAKDNKD
jgi:UDP-3-O-[3-hydroxymyristoyl] glucosamine N-acyltransferase